MLLEESGVERVEKELGLPHNFHFQILLEISLTGSFVLSNFQRNSESMKSIFHIFQQKFMKWVLSAPHPSARWIKNFSFCCIENYFNVFALHNNFPSCKFIWKSCFRTETSWWQQEQKALNVIKSIYYSWKLNLKLDH